MKETFDDGNVRVVGQVANLPRSGGQLASLAENRYYARVRMGTDLDRTSDGRPYISKNVYCIYEQGAGATVIVEVKEVSKCYVLSRP